MKGFKKSFKMSVAILLGVVFSLAVVLGASFLNVKASQTKATSTSNVKYAMVLKTLANPFWVKMKDGILQEAKKQGVKVDVFAATSEDAIEEQLKIFEDAITKGYKGIGIAPISPVNVIPAVVEANKKGIYVVNVDEQINMDQLKKAGGSVVGFVTTDNEKVGAMAATYIVNKLGKQGGKVAIIEGKAGNASGEARKRGATEVFKANKNIQLVASQPADWDRLKALDVATNIMQRFPDIKAFYCANDTMALGALQAVINAGKLGKILVVGTDGIPEAVQSVKSGKLTATIAQDPAKIGAESLKLLIKAVKEKKPISPNQKPVIIKIDPILVTK